MKYLVAASGIKWSYNISGEGRCLLFIHGWGVDRHIWKEQVSHFSKRYKVLTLDLPGHGLSNFKECLFKDLVKDIKSILNDLNITKVSIVSSSLGGLFALKFYDMFAESVERIVFAGFIPKFSQFKDCPYGLKAEDFRKLAQQVENTYPSIIYIFFRSLFSKFERLTVRFKQIQKLQEKRMAPRKEALVYYLNILEKEDLRYVLKGINIPIQFIHGENDEICCLKSFQYMRSICPNASWELFKNSGHFPFLINFNKFNYIVGRFLWPLT